MAGRQFRPYISEAPKDAARLQTDPNPRLIGIAVPLFPPTAL